MIYTKWKDYKRNLKPEIILEKIEKEKKTQPDGSVSFDLFEYQNNASSLYSMIEFPENSISTKNISLLKQAIDISAKAGIINKDTVLQELNKLFELEALKPTIIYNILTSISIDYQLPPEGIKIGSTYIKFFSEFPPEFVSRKETLKFVKSELELEHSGYTKVIVQVKAKSEVEAINIALDDLDLLRAFLSIYSNHMIILRLGNDSFSPINKVRLGQIHTIHKSSGEIINPEHYWYEPTFSLNEVHFIKEQKKIGVMKQIDFLVCNFNNCKYNKKLKHSLLRYVRAFDERNYNVSLLEVWGSLEYLTASDKNNKDDVIKRCSFIFEEHEYHKQILEHLREFRNESVHVGIKNDEVKNYCYQLQFYFAELILFHLERFKLFKSLDYVNQLLVHSSNLEELNKKKDLLEKAIKYRRGE